MKLPHKVIKSDAFTSLTGKAPLLLMVVAAKFNGRNNGDLCVTYAEAYREYGWARGTIAQAFEQLADRGLLVRTRKGGRNVSSLYALGWLPIDDPAVVAKITSLGDQVPTDKLQRWVSWSAAS